MAAIAPEHVRPLRRAEYDQLVVLGAFADERIELLYGVLHEMTPPGPRHCSTIDKLTLLLVRGLGDVALVRIQHPFAASDISEPQPDVAVVPLGEYSDDHPPTAHLLIEVSDSSLAFDRGLKLRLYAESGVPEYWVVNLRDRCIEAHGEARDGGYAETRVYRENESIRPRAFPSLELRVTDVLPRA